MKWTFSFVTLLFSLVLSALASEEFIVYLDQSAPRRTRVTFGLRVETDLGPANVETIYTQQAGPVLLIIKAERDYAARLERDVLVRFPISHPRTPSNVIRSRKCSEIRV